MSNKSVLIRVRLTDSSNLFLDLGFGGWDYLVTEKIFVLFVVALCF